MVYASLRPVSGIFYAQIIRPGHDTSRSINRPEFHRFGEIYKYQVLSHKCHEQIVITYFFAKSKQLLEAIFSKFNDC